MMKRRDFFSAAGAAGAAALSFSQSANASDGTTGDRLFLELRQIEIETEQQKQGLDAFLKDAAIPALNRLGIKPVGVFVPLEELSPIYVLVPHPTLESVVTLTQRLADDAEFLNAGADFLDAPASAPSYARMENKLMRAFKKMPGVATPVKGPDRIFQLRMYESPSVATGQKKIEMFNDAGEIEIFRRVGLNPVFFGETIVGSKMPNLTYMLGHENRDAMKAGWKAFGSDPGWKRLKTMDEYADKNILCGITNIVLKPAEYSQI